VIGKHLTAQLSEVTHKITETPDGHPRPPLLARWPYKGVFHSVSHPVPLAIIPGRVETTEPKTPESDSQVIGGNP
jgi:hypothetical protein